MLQDHGRGSGAPLKASSLCTMDRFMLAEQRSNVTYLPFQDQVAPKAQPGPNFLDSP